MSDEKHLLDEPTTASPASRGESTSKSSLPPAVALGFVIIALLGVIIVMVLRNGSLHSSADSKDVARAEAELKVMRSQLNQDRIAAGLSPLLSETEPIEEIVSRVKKDADSLVALAGSYQTFLTEKDREVTACKSELLNSEKLRKSLSDENVRLNGEYNRALISASDADRLRRELDAMRLQGDAMASEMSELRRKGGASSEEYAGLQRRLDEALRAKDFFENRVKELEGDLSKAKLFASSENELLPAAVELFRNLRQLENMPDSEISSAYSSLAVKLGANVLKTLSFATGSSTLAAADEEAVRGLVSEIPDGDLLLVIGYASETGNVDGNRTLSSDRATAAATLFSSVKRPDQLTQAVYLGQTDRFSSRVPERNQLVEIWHIRKK